MTAWWQGPLLAADTETSGVDLENDRIVTATVVEITPGKPTETFDWLINPGIEIPAEATAVHGITTEHAAADGVDPKEAIGEIHTRLANAWARGIPVIAFNAVFDLTILDREMRRHGHGPLVPSIVVDPMVIDRSLYPFRKGKRTLGATCTHYKLELIDAHTSAADALAAARLAWKLAAAHQQIGDLNLDELHRQQISWHAYQQKDFAGWLRKQAAKEKDEAKRAETLARADAITTDWPVQPHAGDVAAVSA